MYVGAALGPIGAMMSLGIVSERLDELGQGLVCFGDGPIDDVIHSAFAVPQEIALLDLGEEEDDFLVRVETR